MSRKINDGMSAGLRYYYRHHEKNKKISRERAARAKIEKPGVLRERGWSNQGIVGATWEGFLALLEGQQYKCRICLGLIDESAALDHDHETGRIRGALCKRCNVALGQFEDSRVLLARALEYLNEEE